MKSETILWQIKLAMLFTNITQKDIAENTGINLRTLSRRFKNPNDFRVDELIKIGEFLNMSLHFVYSNITIKTFGDLNDDEK